MSDSNRVRQSVSEFYTQAVKSGSGCGCGGGEAIPKGFAAQFAGYGDDVAGLPADAVVNSFGCGNPLAFSEVKPGEVVVDLGSGAGIDLLIAARKAGPSGLVIGVDMTDEMIARARANAAEAGFANIEVRKGIIEDLPVEAASVDWVISNCVINLSPEKDRVFAEIARVLKPGGRMLVSDIVVQDVPAWVRESMALYAVLRGWCRVRGRVRRGSTAGRAGRRRGPRALPVRLRTGAGPHRVGGAGGSNGELLRAGTVVLLRRRRGARTD